MINRVEMATRVQHTAEFAPEAPSPKRGEAVASEPTGPSFMMALPEQLGPKLETTKGAGGVSGDRPDRAAAAN